MHGKVMARKYIKVYIFVGTIALLFFAISIILFVNSNRQRNIANQINLEVKPTYRPHPKTTIYQNKDTISLAPTSFYGSLRIQGGPCYTNPRKALSDFLENLHQGQYEQAAWLYITDYPYWEENVTPSVLTPEERLAYSKRYLEKFCWGYKTCLDFKIIKQEQVAEDQTKFSVVFYEDNKPFVVPAIMNPYSTPEPTPAGGTPIDFIIKKIDGCFISLNLPPITP
jgi:hypothetical protein